jgi:hypothetical protein
MVKTKTNEDRVSLIQNILSKFDLGLGAEVGTFKGEFSKEILKHWSGTLYMIDVWRDLSEEYQDCSNHKFFETNLYDETIKNIDEFGDRAIMIRTTSESASQIFCDSSLDFVYIDANHSYEFVKQDIELWYPKIKKGGYILGHDYLDIEWYKDPNFAENGKDKHIWNGTFYHGLFGVNPAVDEFCEQMGCDLTLTSEWFGSWMIKKN